jgi:class 3 adenylate cyclase
MARVGIATGLVVVGDMIGESGTDKDAVVGDAEPRRSPQAVASPGRVVVSQDTRHLLGQLFELESLGRHDLKGFREPVAFGSVRRKPRRNRFDACMGPA